MLVVGKVNKEAKKNMICPNCNNQLIIKSSQSVLVGCINCKQVFNLQSNNILSPNYKSSRYNINYKSAENFNIGDTIEVDNEEFTILNRTVWVVDCYQFMDDFDADKSSIQYEKSIFQKEVWEIINNVKIINRIEKIGNDLFLSKEKSTNYKNFAFQSQVKILNFFSTGERLEITIANFDTNIERAAFQDGYQSFHLLEGELSYAIEEGLLKKMSNYHYKKHIFEIESIVDNYDINQAKTYIKQKIYKINTNKLTTQNWFYRLFS